MSLPVTVIQGQWTKTQVKANVGGTVAVYACRRKNMADRPSHYETVNAPGGIYPTKYGVHLRGLDNLYSAMRVYNNWIGLSPIDLIPAIPARVVGVGTPPFVRADSFSHGGTSGGGGQ